MKKRLRKNKRIKLEIKQLKMFERDLNNVIYGFDRFFGTDNVMTRCTKLYGCTLEGLIITIKKVRKRIEQLERERKTKLWD